MEVELQKIITLELHNITISAVGSEMDIDFVTRVMEFANHSVTRVIESANHSNEQQKRGAGIDTN